jgi:RimJ/RimL family protein N-acetyltransferase
MSTSAPRSPGTIRPVSLEGRLVRLEPLASGHVADLLAAASDEAVWRWTVEANHTPDLVRAHLERAMAALREGAQLPFATIERASGRAVGSTRFMAIDLAHHRLEVGWTWLDPAAQGQGLNDEAKLLQLRHAFEVLGCRRVEFKTDSLNERSRAALSAIGATFEGIFRNHMLMPSGRMRHSAWYSVIDAEWPEVRARLERRVAAHVARTGGVRASAPR